VQKLKQEPGKGLLAGGGLLLAVLAPKDEAALSRIASLRQPGGSAIGLVLDTSSFAAGGERAARSGRAAAVHTADLLRGSGWRATVVTASDGIPEVWARVGSAAGRVSAGVGR
jgi:hypothetical protein